MLLLVLAVATAVPDLEAAQKAYVDVDYARCRDRAQAALLQPGSVPDRVGAYRLVGLCSAAHGDTDDARDAFRLMLAIDKDARLPDGLSPRFTSSYREAKGSWVGTTPLMLSIASEVIGKDGRTVRIKVEDAAEIVTKVAWRGPSGAMSSPVKKAPQIELELPNGVDIVVVGLDKAQGEVALLDLPARKTDTASPLDPEEKPQPVVDEDQGSALPFIIAGSVAGAVVIAAAAGAAVVLFSPPQTVDLTTDVVFAD